ncbi:SDR family oxidoreductase [Listeria aquatica]|uniref:SDR family oxidoreductase n=1 Tax=Listeria aquatica TaxID=1494960 RepID=UPI003F71B920
MKIFLTGATGFIGSEVVYELIHRGHQVIGLARSEKSADKLKKMGADARLGSLEDLDVLAKGAAESDGVIHLAFTNDFTDFQGAVTLDVAAVRAMGDALVHTNKPFVNTAGTLMVSNLGRMATENDKENDLTGRSLSTQTSLSYSNQGVRTMAVRLAPTVHDENRQGFGTILAGIALQNNKAAYVGDGLNVWPSVHLLDAAKLFVDVLEKGESGKTYNAVGEQAIKLKDLLTEIGNLLQVPVTSISPEDAITYGGPFFGNALQIDNPTSSELTKQELDWHPTHPTLLSDLNTFLSVPENLEHLKNY